MAGRKENLKSLFTNTRTRVILIFTALLLIAAVVIGINRFISATHVGPGASAELASAPGNIQSIPGALNPTVQYAKLQEQQNLSQAQSALKTGSSAIPTIVRTQTLGEGVEVIGSQQGKGGVGFSTLAKEGQLGPQQSTWLQTLKNSNCSKEAISQVVAEGAVINDLRKACSCVALKNAGYALNQLEPVCDCADLKASGINAKQLKDAGYSAARLRDCGYNACQLKSAGFSAQALKEGGFSDGELKGAGYSDRDIARAGGIPDGLTEEDIRKAGCSVEGLKKLRAAGVSAAAIRRISGCSAAQLLAAGYTPDELRKAGYTAAELRNAGVLPADLLKAGYAASDLPTDANASDAQLASARATQCSVTSLRAQRAKGVSALDIRKKLGCSLAALKAAGYTAKELKDAGYTAAELKNAGFDANALKGAGFAAKELKDAGFSAKELKDAGFTAKALKDAGFGANALKNAGFDATALKNAGFGAKALKDAGFGATALSTAGFTPSELADAGFPSSSEVAGLGQPTLPGANAVVPALPVSAQQSASLTPQQENAQQLQKILEQQNKRLEDQRFQQQIQQRTSEMLSSANQSLQGWQKVAVQTYTNGKEEDGKTAQGAPSLISPASTASATAPNSFNAAQQQQNAASSSNGVLLKTGDIVFAVIDTSVNSDEQGPILATVVSGRFKGAKLIGSFNLPSNAGKMIISFNTMSVPGADKSTSISAVAIDPNTARTALSSRTDNHYLLRYGSLFAASFLEGFGNAFQSADTTITVGGTGGGDNITVQNGINRSVLENAVIGLATLGKQWGQVAQQQFNRPTTVEVFSGTGIGVLFTQDLTSL